MLIINKTISNIKYLEYESKSTYFYDVTDVLSLYEEQNNQTSASSAFDAFLNSNYTMNKQNICSSHISYLDIESYCYLFIMCPLAFVGIVLNIISLLVFKDKSFTTLTFKYLRLITGTDLFICIIVIPYCLTAYTQPWNTYDWYARHFYLVYIYIPGANFAINLSTFLNVLVTIERLVSVGWPMQKHSLFKPSRYFLSVVIVIILSIAFNVLNFFLYEIVFCQSRLVPRSFTMKRWWSFYGYAKEIITRILPIILLLIANIVLIYIVRKSRNRMRHNIGSAKFHVINENVEMDDRSKTDELISSMPTTALVKKPLVAKTNRQENQLTMMTICVTILYLVSSIPMVFAYPGIWFTAEQTQEKTYKMYAALVNILELLQCSFRFLIYFCFTTQFRQKFYELKIL